MSAYPDSRCELCLFSGCHLRILVKSCLMSQLSSAILQRDYGMVLCTKQGYGGKEKAVTLKARKMVGNEWLDDRMRLTTLEARFSADSPATLPHMGLNTHSQTQGCDFYFLKQERKCLGRHASQRETLIPSGAARASFGSACLFVSSLCLSFSPSPPPRLFLVPQPLHRHHGEPARRGGECIPALCGVDL